MAALGLLVRTGTPCVDRATRDWVAAHYRPGVARALDPLVWLSGWLPVAVVLLLVALARVRRERGVRPLLATGTALLAATASTLVLKILLARPGPTGVVPLPRDGAWPSGHTVALTLAAVLVVGRRNEVGGLRTWRRRAAWLFLPGLLAAALVYRGDHWVTDVAAGILVGYLAARLAEWVGGRGGEADPHEAGPDAHGR